MDQYESLVKQLQEKVEQFSEYKQQYIQDCLEVIADLKTRLNTQLASANYLSYLDGNQALQDSYRLVNNKIIIYFALTLMEEPLVFYKFPIAIKKQSHSYQLYSFKMEARPLYYPDSNDNDNGNVEVVVEELRHQLLSRVSRDINYLSTTNLSDGWLSQIANQESIKIDLTPEYLLK